MLFMLRINYFNSVPLFFRSGGNWPSSVVLWLIDDVTWKSCQGAEANLCDTPAQVEVTPKNIPIYRQFRIRVR